MSSVPLVKVAEENLSTAGYIVTIQRVFDPDEINRIIDWYEFMNLELVIGERTDDGLKFIFRNEEDAVAFRLRFGI